MQPSCGMIFIFLLVRLQWNKSNTEDIKVNETNNENSSIRDNNQSTVQPTSHRFVLPMTTAMNSTTVSHAAPTAANAQKNVTKRKEMSSQSNSTSPRPTDGTTLSSSVTTGSKGGINNSATNFNRIPTSLATLTTMGDFSGVTKSAAATPTSTVTLRNSTVTYSTPLAAVLPGGNSSINPIALFPTSITLTSPTVKQDSLTPNYPIQQTTEQNQHFSNTSTTSPNSKDANKEKINKGGVIVGVTVGAILGSILIGLIGYFICGKKRSESFSHRRLYDDTRNDPVLHLDNSLGPYDTSFGCTSDDRAAGKAEKDNAGCPSDGIPMADMTPSHPSPDCGSRRWSYLINCECCNKYIYFRHFKSTLNQHPVLGSKDKVCWAQNQPRQPERTTLITHGSESPFNADGNDSRGIRQFRLQLRHSGSADTCLGMCCSARATRWHPAGSQPLLETRHFLARG